MIKSFIKKTKLVLLVAVVLSVAVSFMPISSGTVYAAKTKQPNKTKALPQVTEVYAANTDTGIKLDWDKVDNASGYEVFRLKDSSREYSQLGTTKASSYFDHNVNFGKTYSYLVRAYIADEPDTTGLFSKVSISRSSVVSNALAFLGCKESNGSYEKIIDSYNAEMKAAIGYGTPWSAVFVSSVANKSKASSIIVRGNYCPSIQAEYKKGKKGMYSYTAGNSYVPKAGDVVFFDWDKNGIPNNTGIVASVSGKTVKAIEGNLRDAVGYRTFSIGNSYILGYGLPHYDEANGIVYTGNPDTSVGCGELEALGIGTEPDGCRDLGNEYDFVEQKVKDNLGAGVKLSDYDKMVYIIKKVKANAKTENINCSKSQYFAAFIYELCQETGLDASIITAEDEEGDIRAWIETSLDNQWYKIDPSSPENQIEKFTPEATDSSEE